MMLIIAFAILGLAVSEPIPPKNGNNYHQEVGIRQAARIKAAEEASLDGINSRIVGGSSVSLGKYPYMAGIVITLRTGYTSICGGTILSNTKVITAAHCWWDGHNQARQFVVVLGSLYVFSGGIRYTTKDVLLHPKWDASSKLNNLAIVTFPWVSYTNYIANVALSIESFTDNSFVGFSADALGYGVRTDDGSIPSSQTLNQITLRIENITLCRSLYGTGLDSSIVCARGENGGSTCDGDEGGPLVFLNGKLTVLIGVGNFNHRQSCQLGYPVGFTSVNAHLTWIQNQLTW